MRGSVAIVAGCGALGNEVVKNLLLLGWGHILAIDFDVIEKSNLTRSVLFDAGDVGRFKVEAMRDRGRSINSDVEIVPLHGDLREVLSAGLVARSDVVFGCLDSVEGRVALAQLARQAKRVLIDGGLGVWEGTISVFSPDMCPCFACGLSGNDWKELNLRRSCSAYAERARQAGGVSTTPGVASTVCGHMVNIALKYVHGMLGPAVFPAGQQIRIDAYHDRFWKSGLFPNPECLNATVGQTPVRSFALGRADTWRSIHRNWAERRDGGKVSLHLPVPLLVEAVCESCGTRESGARACIEDRVPPCVRCGATVVPRFATSIEGGEAFLDKTPQECGYPSLSWITGIDRSGDEWLFEVGGLSDTLSSIADWSRHGITVA